MPPNLIQINNIDDKSLNKVIFESKQSNSQYIHWFETYLQSNNYYQKQNFGLDSKFVDLNYFHYLINDNGYSVKKLLRGRFFTNEEVSDNSKVVLIEEGLLPLLDQDNKTIQVPIHNNNRTYYDKYEVVGILEDTTQREYGEMDESNRISGRAYFSITQKDSISFDENTLNTNILIVSKTAEESNQLYRNLLMKGFYMDSTLNRINQAQEEYQKMREDQVVVLYIMTILCGLTLISSVSNVLKDRKLEIAIKLAIGISPKNIYLQFIIESIILFFSNIIIILFLVFSGSIIWLTFNFGYQGNALKSIVIFPYSIHIFFILAFSFTILSIVVFLYNIVQTNIIELLKQE